MKKRTLKRLSKLSVIALLVVAIAGGILAMPHAQAADYQASYIERVDNIKVDYTKYLDSSVMQKLPETVRNDQEIAVIILMDQTTILEAYEAGDKTMSLTEFALSGGEAEQIRNILVIFHDQHRLRHDRPPVFLTADAVSASFFSHYTPMAALWVNIL